MKSDKLLGFIILLIIIGFGFAAWGFIAKQTGFMSAEAAHMLILGTVITVSTISVLGFLYIVIKRVFSMDNRDN